MEHGLSTFWEHEGSCAFTAVAWRGSTLFVGNMDGEIITFHPTKKWIYQRKSEVLYKTNTVRPGSELVLGVLGADWSSKGATGTVTEDRNDLVVAGIERYDP
ncbi:hypothetical protein F5877DRAFT_72957 [Lentinula edodes]|nr:hypothetical protein F5877DRAFT_72957 [Lentinula edodes]